MMQRKVLVVLYTKIIGTKNRYLVVRDKVHKEWTFISGTCEKYERPITCAIREVYEETRGAINLRRKRPKIRKIYRTYDGSHRRVDVIFIQLRYSTNHIAKIKRRFLNASTDNPGWDENTHISFETISKLLSRKNVWNFVRKVVRESSLFAN